MSRKRGHIYSPDGYLLDCMDCDAQFSFTEEEGSNTTSILWGAGWAYFRGWFCPECAKVNGVPVPGRMCRADAESGEDA